MKASEQKPTELFRCSVCKKVCERDDLVQSSRIPNLLVPPCNEPRGAATLCMPARDNDIETDCYIARRSLDELYAQAKRGALLQLWAENLGITIPEEKMVFQRRPPVTDVVAAARDARAEVLRMNAAWPLPEVVRKLVQAADHLLGHHSCDLHGYEEVQRAAAEARDWLTKLGYDVNAGGSVFGSHVPPGTSE